MGGFEPVTRLPRKSDDSGREHHGFSWHTIDPTVLNDARSCIEAANKAGKTAVVWEGMREVDEGFWLPWKEPSTFNAGCLWFFRKLGNLVAEQGLSARWFVIGHNENFNAALWAEAKASLKKDAASHAVRQLQKAAGRIETAA